MSNEAVRVATVLGTVCWSARALGNGEEATKIRAITKNKLLTLKSGSLSQHEVRANKSRPARSQHSYSSIGAVCEPYGTSAIVASFPACRIARSRALFTLFAPRSPQDEAWCSGSVDTRYVRCSPETFRNECSSNMSMEKNFRACASRAFNPDLVSPPDGNPPSPPEHSATRMTIPWSLQILAAMTVLEDASKRERSHGAPPALEITMSTIRRKDIQAILAAKG